MNIQQLRHFVALAERGSFTRAAAHAHLTQPALSRSIAQLEAELGMKLVDRIGRRCEVTAFGSVILEHARRVLFEADELVKVARQQIAGEAGRMLIGLGSTPSALLTAPLLGRFAEAGRPLHVLLLHGAIPQQVQALRERKLDMLVVEVRGVMPTVDLQIEPMPILRTGFLVRPSHPLRHRPAASFDDLQPWPLATTLLAEEQIRILTTLYGPHAHPDESVAFHSDAIDGLLQTAKTSDTIYYGVLAPAHSAILGGELVELPIHPAPDPSQFAIVRLAGRSMPPMFPFIRELVRSLMDEWSTI
ncbi:LysR family transcriptional regulator [Pseudochelatococcus lubricantis]|uniref:LysR family transcriptional regulator n=1 Tax=Pseudochelatococcus lubricantis TaxID=1538102 RepID=UPI0035E5FD92